MEREEIDRLLEKLRSDDQPTCVDAAFGLAESRDEQTVDGLVATLQDPRPFVRNYAVFALAEIGNAKAIRPIIRMLGDPDIGVRSRAAWALGRIGDFTCMADLAAALRESLEIDTHLCRQLIVALADIGGREAVESILPAFESSDPEVRIIAARFLGYVGDRMTRARLKELRDQEENEGVRTAIDSAIEALEEDDRERGEP
jgi:HEAT repeat protein